MDLKRLVAAAAAIATSIGIPVLTGGVAPVNAAPADPPPVDPGALGPGGAMGDAPAPNPNPPGPYTPQPPVHRQGAGGPKGGGGVPSYAEPRQIHLYTPPPAPPPPPGG
jgi:hypothetical protein